MTDIIKCNKCEKELYPNESVSAEQAQTTHDRICHIQSIPLRNSVPLFNISHLFTKVSTPVAGSEISEPKKQFTLWLAKAQRHYPDLLIYDTNGHVNETKLDQCLFPLDHNEIKEILKHLPGKEYSKVVNISANWGYRIGEDEELDPAQLSTLNVFTKPIARLEDPSELKRIDWQNFVDSLVAYKTEEKDQVLRLAHRSALPRGIDVHINPNRIECTNGGVGKSGFYDAVGENPGKVTAGSFLGFAKSPNEVFPGLIDGSECAIGVDQIESQSASQIMRFMFNALERGYDTVFSGSTRIKVNTRSIFAFLANRIGSIKDPSKSFANLIDHLSFNPAIGRRIALLLYGDYRKITKKPKPEEVLEWKERIKEFRAIEDYCWDKIQALVHSSKIWAWINLPIEGYERQVSELISSLSDDTLRTFLEEHAAGAQARIRGAAVYSAIVDHMKDIALDQFDQTRFLDDCEVYLQQYKEINFSSVVKISSEWAKEKSTQASVCFNNQPDYMQEILSAIEQFKCKYPNQTNFMLSSISYKPKNESYRTLNEAVRKLNKRANPVSTLEQIKRYFFFDFVKEDKDWKITILDAKPNVQIKELGKLLDQIDQFDQSTAFGETTEEKN